MKTNMTDSVEVILSDDDSVIGVALTVEDCDAWFESHDPGYDNFHHVTRPLIRIEDIEHEAHSGHEYGGAYARAAALAGGDPDWMNATGGSQRGSSGPES